MEKNELERMVASLNDSSIHDKDSKSKWKHGPIEWVAFMALAVIGAFMFAILWWMWGPVATVDSWMFDGQPMSQYEIPTEKKVYSNDPEAQDFIRVASGATRCWHYEGTVVARQSLVGTANDLDDGVVPGQVGRVIGSAEFPQPGAVIDIPKGCDPVVLVGLPANVPPGQYRLHLELEFNPNPLRSIVVTARTQPFEIQ